jgi:hypothetical protein
VISATDSSGVKLLETGSFPVRKLMKLMKLMGVYVDIATQAHINSGGFYILRDSIIQLHFQSNDAATTIGGLKNFAESGKWGAALLLRLRHELGAKEMDDCFSMPP